MFLIHHEMLTKLHEHTQHKKSLTVSLDGFQIAWFCLFQTGESQTFNIYAWPGQKRQKRIMMFPVFVRLCMFFTRLHIIMSMHGSNETASIFVCLHRAINLKATQHQKTTEKKGKEKSDHFHFEKTFKDSHILRAIISFYFYHRKIFNFLACRK